MRDPLLDFAQSDPSVVACLTPGGWWSPLRQGVVWPGAPRNFSAEPAKWYNFVRFAASVPTTDDFLFRMRFTVQQSMLGTTWYLFAGDVCSLMVNYQNSVYWYCSMGVMSGYSNITLIASSLITVAGEYEITARITGSAVTLEGVRYNADGTVAITKTATGTITSRLVASGSYTQSSFNGTISSIEMKNVTTGSRLVYPSYIEKLRLVTYTNVRTDRARFEAANSSLGWSIKTALPAGITGTVLAKISGAVVTDSTKWNRTTATFTGLAADTLDWLLVCNATLTADKIADASK